MNLPKKNYKNYTKMNDKLKEKTKKNNRVNPREKKEKGN